MNKRDMSILAVLIGLLIMWPMVGPQLERQFFPKPPAPVPPPTTEEPVASRPDTEVQATDAPPVLTEAAASVAEPVAEVVAEALPEETTVLSNDVVAITLSSLGGTVVHARMDEYNKVLEDDGEVVELDFSERRALAYTGLVGLGENASFQMTVDDSTGAILLKAHTPGGLNLTRQVLLDDSYRLLVTDVFSNPTAQVLTLPVHDLSLGLMREDGHKPGRGIYYLGVDALLHGGEGVKYFGKKIMPKAFKGTNQLVLEDKVRVPVEWVAAKNRFFTQILAPTDGGDDATWYAERADAESKTISAVAGSIQFPSLVLESGQAFQRDSYYYVGPKKFSMLNQYGRYQVNVMDFGFFSPICKALLWVLNVIHDKMWPHNYGIAIILLTVIIRVIFWPITHKGTESMRRMQEIQPLMKELQAKNKDNPQKQQKEMFALYKEHKVNPVGGCLPMLVQIPVFFALFVVLRSAIELRFAEFLWISDLSEPEHLWANVLPFGGLNILPFVMSISMVWQQKLMPTTADPRQAKMMQFMPIMMLFVFYTFASGLVLYWTTSQILMIVQQLVYQRRKAKKEAVAPG